MRFLGRLSTTKNRLTRSATTCQFLAKTTSYLKNLKVVSIAAMSNKGRAKVGCLQ